MARTTDRGQVILTVNRTYDPADLDIDQLANTSQVEELMSGTLIAPQDGRISDTIGPLSVRIYSLGQKQTE
jgi:hypothetical protein